MPAEMKTFLPTLALVFLTSQPADASFKDSFYGDDVCTLKENGCSLSGCNYYCAEEYMIEDNIVTPYGSSISGCNCYTGLLSPSGTSISIAGGKVSVSPSLVPFPDDGTRVTLLMNVNGNGCTSVYECSREPTYIWLYWIFVVLGGLIATSCALNCLVCIVSCLRDCIKATTGTFKAKSGTTKSQRRSQRDERTRPLLSNMV